MIILVIFGQITFNRCYESQFTTVLNCKSHFDLASICVAYSSIPVVVPIRDIEIRGKSKGDDRPCLAWLARNCCAYLHNKTTFDQVIHPDALAGRHPGYRGQRTLYDS